VGFLFVFVASIVTAFASAPGVRARARLLSAFSYSGFLVAAALLVGMVRLLLLGRSTASSGLAQPASGPPAPVPPPGPVPEESAAPRH
jgi:hypothetical protein